jgi:hypothetical protein
MRYYTVNNGKEFPINDHFRGFSHCSLILDKRNHEKLMLEIKDCRGVSVHYDKTSQALDYLSSIYLTT